jgi:hypothetical protein
VISRSPQILATQLDDEIILMSIERGNYYGLKTTSRRIWELVENPCTLSALSAQLALEYDAPPGQIEADVQAFVLKLADQALLVVT